MSFKATAKELRYLRVWPYGNDYTVLGAEEVTRKVRRPLPYWTDGCREGGYLEAYSEYYKEAHPYCCRRRLRDEYRFNRPEYEIEVTYNLLEVELTKRGKRVARERYIMHSRNAQRYAKLLEE